MTNNFRDDVYDIPTINLVDGVPSDDTIQDMAYTTESAFNKISNAIGNIHGRGIHLDEKTRFIANLASAIGSTEDDIAVPNAVNFLNYTETFVPNDSKYFILSIIPGSNFVIQDGINPSTYWNKKNSYSEMSEDGDYVLDGVKLVFYKEPTQQFNVIYDGQYFDIGYQNGYMPNVLPSQKLRSESKIDKPTLSLSANGRFKLTIPKPSEFILQELSSEFNYSVAEYLQPFISANGAIECPDAFVGIWIKDGVSFYKLNTDKIYIISGEEFEFTTSEEISVNDEFAVYIANRSITEDIKVIFNNLFKHSHNGQDGSAVVGHASLSGLIPKTDNANINYGGSIIPGNDHPQYINREGFRNDPGSYNNAMLGDLLIASTSELSQFNNVLADSNKLVFGSMADGHSIKRRFTYGDLLLFSGFNGLSIEYNNTDEESYGLSINGNKFGVDYEDNNLILETSSGILELRTLNGLERQSLIAGLVKSRDVEVEQALAINNLGELSIGPFSFTNIINDLVVTVPGITNKIKFHPRVELEEAYIDNASVDTLLLENGKRILFGTNPGSLNNSYLTTVNTTVGAFYSYESFKFINTGKNTGVGFASADGLTEFSNIYSSSQNGSLSTPSDHDLYIESGDGGIYFVKGTRGDKILDGSTYTWKNTVTGKVRVDNLRQWPKTNIFAHDGNFDQVNINSSNLQDKKGLRFGETNGIYVTGNSAPCPPGIMVVESQNGIILVNPTSNADSCGSQEYAPLTAGVIQSFGGISTDENITAIGDLTVGRKISSDELNIASNTTLSGILRVDGSSRFDKEAFFNSDSIFNSNLDINGNVNVKNTITSQSLNILSTSNFNGVTHINNDMFVNGGMQIKSLTASGGVILNSTLRVGGESSFDGKVTYSGDTTFNANLDIRGSATVNGGLETTSLKVTNIAIFDAISQFNSNVSFSGNLLASNASFTGNVSIGGESTSTTISGNVFINTESFSIGGPVEIFGITTVKDKLVTTSSAEVGGTLNVNGSANFNSSVNINSQLSSQSLEVAQSITAGQDIKTEGSVTAGAILVERGITANGPITGESIYSESGFSASSESESSMGTLRLSGGFDQSSSTDLFSVSADASFKSDVNIQGEMKVNSTLNVGNDASGVSILTNNITVNGQNGIIDVVSAKINKIYGENYNVPVPNVILQYAPALISVISGKPFVSFESGVNFQDKALFSNAAIFSDIIYATEIQFLGSPDNAINIVAKRARYAD